MVKMYKLFTLFIVSITALPLCAVAQYNETIRSGRPGEALSPFAVGGSVFQVQAGVDFSGLTNNDEKQKEYTTSPNITLRMGINNHFDLNCELKYSDQKFNSQDSTFKKVGLKSANVGARVNIYSGEGYTPSVGLQLNLKLPILSKDFSQNYLATSATFAAEQKISNKFSFIGNIGADWDGNSAQPGGTYAVNINYTFLPKWSTYIENYGNFGKGEFENLWSTGIAWLITDYLQFDVYGGAGHNNGQVDYLASFGVSYRVITKPKKVAK